MHFHIRTTIVYIIALLFLNSPTIGERMNNTILHYWFWYLPTTLDTAEADKAGVMSVAKNIYAPLVSTFLDGKAQGMIAESWSVDKTGTVWRFKIKENMVFDDGSAITAEVVLQNFRRILWLTRSDGLLLNSLMPEISQWKNYTDELKCINVDGDTIVFKFNKRPTNLFEEISMPIYGIANPKCFNNAGQWKSPSCISASGQYSVKEIGADKIVLQSRHKFPEAENAPEIVEIRAKTDRNTLPEILSGNGDLTVLPSFDLTTDVMSKVRSGRLKITEEPMARMHFMQLNNNRRPFKDKKLRQSIRDSFLNALKTNNAFASETELSPSFIPKGGVGYVPVEIPAQKQCAKMDGTEITILLPPKPTHKLNKGQKIQRAIESAISQALKLNGLKARVINCDGAELLARRQRNDFDILFRFSGVSIDDPYAALRMMFLSNIGACIPDPSQTIAQLIEQAEKSDDSNMRKQIAEKINTTIFDEAAIVTYTHSSLVYVHTPAFDLSRFNLFSDPIEFRAISCKFSR